MKIGMIAAMRSEMEAVLSKIGEPVRTECVPGFEVSEYRIGENSLYLVQSGAGEIYAAGAAQMLIDRYGVGMMLNYGVVGGLTEEMGLCRTAVVEKVVHYDYDTSFIDNCEPAKYPDYPDAYLKTDEKLVEKAVKAVPGLKRVICASGDKFIGEPEKKREMNRKYGAHICEMEAAGILLTCDRANVPALMIKAVSDSVTGGAEEFVCMVREAAEECVKVLSAVLEDVK